jgi:DNA repair exonuclease SbcCD ATPase subunit
MEEMPALPPRPDELAQLEERRAKIRAERQEIASELQRIEGAAWKEAQAAQDGLDAVAEKLASGEIAEVTRDNLPEQRDILRSRLDTEKRSSRLPEPSKRWSRPTKPKS